MHEEKRATPWSFCPSINESLVLCLSLVKQPRQSILVNCYIFALLLYLLTNVKIPIIHSSNDISSWRSLIYIWMSLKFYKGIYRYCISGIYRNIQICPFKLMIICDVWNWQRRRERLSWTYYSSAISFGTLSSDLPFIRNDTECRFSYRSINTNLKHLISINLVKCQIIQCLTDQKISSLLTIIYGGLYWVFIGTLFIEE